MKYLQVIELKSLRVLRVLRGEIFRLEIIFVLCCIAVFYSEMSRQCPTDNKKGLRLRVRPLI
jgi:hypothetical protein